MYITDGIVCADTYYAAVQIEEKLPISTCEILTDNYEMTAKACLWKMEMVRIHNLPLFGWTELIIIYFHLFPTFPLVILTLM